MMNKRWLVPASLVAAALIAAGCGSSGNSGSTSGSGGNTGGSSGTVKTAKVSGNTVLTNSQGFVLYWFARDNSTKSHCHGSCTAFCPPEKGPVTGSVIKGTFGTITRSDGSKQATFNGHPLYTYKGDSQPGEAKGNGLNINGGLWHEVTTTGAAPAPNPSPTTTGGGSGGYTY